MYCNVPGLGVFCEHPIQIYKYRNKQVSNTVTINVAGVRDSLHMLTLQLAPFLILARVTLVFVPHLQVSPEVTHPVKEMEKEVLMEREIVEYQEE